MVRYQSGLLHTFFSRRRFAWMEVNIPGINHGLRSALLYMFYFAVYFIILHCTYYTALYSLHFTVLTILHCAHYTAPPLLHCTALTHFTVCSDPHLLNEPQKLWRDINENSQFTESFKWVQISSSFLLCRHNRKKQDVWSKLPPPSGTMFTGQLRLLS